MAWKRKPKDYKCPHCVKDFDKLSQLKRHYKDAHKDESMELENLTKKEKR